MSPLRIGDAERDAAMERLGEHFAAGRLTQDEFDERGTQVAAARYEDDLRPLFADLPERPEEQRRTEVAAMAGGWPGRGRRARALGIIPLAVPLFAVAMIVVGAVVLTPWLLFAVFWLGCIASRGSRHHAPGRGGTASSGGCRAPAH